MYPPTNTPDAFLLRDVRVRQQISTNSSIQRRFLRTSLRDCALYGILKHKNDTDKALRFVFPQRMDLDRYFVVAPYSLCYWHCEEG